MDKETFIKAFRFFENLLAQEIKHANQHYPLNIDYLLQCNFCKYLYLIERTANDITFEIPAYKTLCIPTNKGFNPPIYYIEDNNQLILLADSSSDILLCEIVLNAKDTLLTKRYYQTQVLCSEKLLLDNDFVKITQAMENYSNALYINKNKNSFCLTETYNSIYCFGSENNENLMTICQTFEGEKSKESFQVVNFAILDNETLSDSHLKGSIIINDISIPLIIDLENEKVSKENFQKIKEKHQKALVNISKQRILAIRKEITLTILEDAYHQSDESHTIEEEKQVFDDLKFSHIALFQTCDPIFYFSFVYSNVPVQLLAYTDENFENFEPNIG